MLELVEKRSVRVQMDDGSEFAVTEDAFGFIATACQGKQPYIVLTDLGKRRIALVVSRIVAWYDHVEVVPKS